MPGLEAHGPNAEQIKYWNEQAGPKWVALQALLDTQIEPLGRRAMDSAGVLADTRVLDVGCGCGQTSLELARRVGSSGEVTGIDISTVMLERARQTAQELGVRNAVFLNADAQTYAFPPARSDVVFSRFGVMFFVDADAAFANLHHALRPEGRVAFVCWRSLFDNPWLLVPMMAAASHIQLPPPPAPDAPGPFSLADPERVRGILSRAGFGDIVLDELNETLSVGGGAGLDQTVDFLLQMGPTAAVLRDPANAAALPRIIAAVREALAPFLTPQGVRMPSAAWIVTARRL